MRSFRCNSSWWFISLIFLTLDFCFFIYSCFTWLELAIVLCDPLRLVSSLFYKNRPICSLLLESFSTLMVYGLVLVELSLIMLLVFLLSMES